MRYAIIGLLGLHLGDRVCIGTAILGLVVVSVFVQENFNSYARGTRARRGYIALGSIYRLFIDKRDTKRCVRGIRCAH